jgi:ficolin
MIGKPFKVFCDMDTDDGGWTVFQKRDDFVPQEDFYRTWLEYKRGFGDLQRQFWLGNDRLSMLTNQDLYQLRIDLEDFDGEKRFAQYYSIRVAKEVDKYQLTVGSYIKGDAGDSFIRKNNMKFSTKDQDYDTSPSSCAQLYNGAWWYQNCHATNLNGAYLRGHHPAIYAQGVTWYSFRGQYYSLKRTEMKIPPIWFKP